MVRHLYADWTKWCGVSHSFLFPCFHRYGILKSETKHSEYLQFISDINITCSLQLVVQQMEHQGTEILSVCSWLLPCFLWSYPDHPVGPRDHLPQPRGQPQPPVWRSTTLLWPHVNILSLVLTWSNTDCDCVYSEDIIWIGWRKCYHHQPLSLAAHHHSPVYQLPTYCLLPRTC